jgi:hypothetical protein
MRVPSEESIVSPTGMQKKTKKKAKITISLGGLVSSQSFGTIDQIVDAAASLSTEQVLPPVEAPQGLHVYEPREYYPDPYYVEMLILD